MGLRRILVWLSIIAAILLAACSGSSASGQGVDFELTLFQNANHARGEKLRLDDLKGRPVVVNFWFPSCPPCVAEMPDLERAFQKHRRAGVEFVGIQLVGLDTVQDGQDFVERLGVTYALGPDEDGTIIRNYKVTGFPATVFLDKEHKVVRTWTGILNEEKLDELMQEIIN